MDAQGIEVLKFIAHNLLGGDQRSMDNTVAYLMNSEWEKIQKENKNETERC